VVKRYKEREALPLQEASDRLGVILEMARTQHRPT
jgi:hypothetical protein